MANAIEMFRQQREAVEQVHQRLVDVSQLLSQLNEKASALACDEELQTAFRDEQRWLAEARQLVGEVRRLRQSEDPRWLAVTRRWGLALLFALVSAGVSGAGYAAVTLPRDEADASVRQRAAFGDAVRKRVETMTPAELRQFDRLLMGSGSGR